MAKSNKNSGVRHAKSKKKIFGKKIWFRGLIEFSKYGSVVFQSGELTSKNFKDYLFSIVQFTHKKYPHLGITLSCGELDYNFFKKIKRSGCDSLFLEKIVGGKLNFEFNFGRPFPEDISGFSLIIHCGACMVDRQNYSRRLLMANKAGVPITNYGIFLTYANNKEMLNRVTDVFRK